MIAALVVIVLAQPAHDYLPPAEALERVLPQPWREVVSAPESVILEGLIPIAKRSREVKVRWRRSLDEETESLSAFQRALLDGTSYRIPGPGWAQISLCGPPIPNLRLTFAKAKRVVTAEICFGCGTLWLRFDEKGRQVRDESFSIAQDAWLEIFAPHVPEDDYVAQRKRRHDEVEERIRRRVSDGGVP